MTTTAVPTSEAGSRKAAPPPMLSFETSQPTKLFIGGITRHTTTKQLRDHFSQFGKVLDCVAMRTQDGHPRGFGYVTLDSATAAHHCLQAPQLIDNRVVDMKLAVPEGSGSNFPTPKGSDYSGSMFKGQSDFNTDMFMGHDFNMTTPFGGSQSWWGGDSMGLDCLDLLSGQNSQVTSPHGMGLLLPPTPVSAGNSFLQVHEDPLDGMGLLLPPVLSCEHKSSLLPADFQSAKMSANAPEFVPSGVQQRGSENHGAAKKMGRARAPLGELTNIVQADDILKPFKSPTKKNADMGQGRINLPQAESPSSIKADEPISPPSDIEEAKPLEDKTKDVTVEAVKQDKGEVNDDDSESHESDSENSEAFVGELPSIGSAEHASGECKRCNFFAKGRCQNGKDCVFCHLPHDKRKPSRQEKRERRAAWMDRELGCQDEAQMVGSMADSLFPNFMDMLGQNGPAPPPGLAEAEAFSFMPMGQTMPGLTDQYSFQQPLTSAFLSTTPSLATSASSTPFPTPLPTPTAGAAAGPMFFATSMSMVTSETQTGDYRCNSCFVTSGKSMQEEAVVDNQIVWAREDLLRMRDGVMKMETISDVRYTTRAISKC